MFRACLDTGLAFVFFLRGDDAQLPPDDVSGLPRRPATPAIHVRVPSHCGILPPEIARDWTTPVMSRARINRRDFARIVRDPATAIVCVQDS